MQRGVQNSIRVVNSSKKDGGEITDGGGAQVLVVLYFKAQQMLTWIFAL